MTLYHLPRNFSTAQVKGKHLMPGGTKLLSCDEVQELKELYPHIYSKLVVLVESKSEESDENQTDDFYVPENPEVVEIVEATEFKNQEVEEDSLFSELEKGHNNEDIDYD